MERRYIEPEVVIEEREVGDQIAPRFAGKALAYNSRTAIGNPMTFGFYEEIAPGASTRTIANDDIAFLVNHSTMHVVSRTSAKSLTLDERSDGVFTDSALDTNLSYVNDLVTNLRNKNVTGMSFGFAVPKGGDEWKMIDLEARDDNGDVQTVQAELRVIHELTLMEVSAVTFPAYTDTEAMVRDAPVLGERRAKYDETEHPLRSPEVNAARRAKFERHARFLAARHNLPSGKGE